MDAHCLKKDTASAICELNAKIDQRTNFRLASFTKQFTAMAVMMLVHDGKLRYDQTLTEIFPDFPPYGKNITIRNLLNHTGGLPDYEDLMDAPGKSERSALVRPNTKSRTTKSSLF